jgi:hypothetical protein
MPAHPYRDRDEDALSQRFAGALIISLLAHTSLFGVVQLGNMLHWWDARPFSMFRKVRLTEEDIAKLREEQQRRRTRLSIRPPRAGRPTRRPATNSRSGLMELRPG